LETHTLAKETDTAIGWQELLTRSCRRTLNSDTDTSARKGLRWSRI